MMHAYSAVRNRGGAIRLANVTQRVKDLFVVTRLLTVFDCYKSAAEAVASFEQQGAGVGALTEHGQCVRYRGMMRRSVG